MGEEKRIIEAALFISSRPMALEEFRVLTGIGALGFLRQSIESLKTEYEGRSIEILEADGKFEMRVRQEYLERVKHYAQGLEISKSALRTLAYLSRHDGILKSELVKKVGAKAYDDVRELVENGFLRSRKAGRSSKLTLTDKFRSYFSIKDVPRGQALELEASDAPEAGSVDQGDASADEDPGQMRL